MKFKEFIESAWGGNFTYKLPEDKEQQLYDFYMFSLFLRTGDKQLDYVIDEIADNLLLPLKKNLLDALTFAIAAEIRHVFDNATSPLFSQAYLNKIYAVVEQELGPRYRDILKRYRLLSDQYSGLIPKSTTDDYNSDIKGANDSYDQAYINFSKAGGTLVQKIELCDFLFSLRLPHAGRDVWNSYYGGKAWSDICKGWLRLNSANDRGSLISAIDHVYDLQHNTDTVFNKLANYYKQGYSWLRRALDAKFESNNPYSFYGKISPQLRPIASRILKKNFGITKQSYTQDLYKSNDKQDQPLNQKYDSNSDIEHNGTYEDLTNYLENSDLTKATKYKHNWLTLVENFRHEYKINSRDVRKLVNYILDNLDSDPEKHLKGVSDKSAYYSIYEDLQKAYIDESGYYDKYKEGFNLLEKRFIYKASVPTWAKETGISLIIKFSDNLLQKLKLSDRNINDKVISLIHYSSGYISPIECRDFIYDINDKKPNFNNNIFYLTLNEKVNFNHSWVHMIQRVGLNAESKNDFKELIENIHNIKIEKDTYLEGLRSDYFAGKVVVVTNGYPKHGFSTDSSGKLYYCARVYSLTTLGYMFFTPILDAHDLLYGLNYLRNFKNNTPMLLQKIYDIYYKNLINQKTNYLSISQEFIEFIKSLI